MVGPAEGREPRVLAARELAAAGLGGHDSTRCLRTASFPGLAQLWFRVLRTRTQTGDAMGGKEGEARKSGGGAGVEQLPPR
eukprot:8941345-Alexandrium_andersonii.AAC.1